MATGKIDKAQLNAELKTAGLFMAGMIAGAQISRQLQKRTGVGELLDGLDGVSKRMIAPAITTAAGAALGLMLPKKEMRTVGFGMAAMGGALTLNELGVRVLPVSAPCSPGVKGLGYTMDELPDPSVMGIEGGSCVEGLEGDPSFIDANGNMFDAQGNMINGLGEYRDSDGNLYDDNGNPINGLGDTTDEYGNVYDSDGNVLMGGFTEGEGESGGDGHIPGIGTVDTSDSIPGLGDTDFNLDDGSMAGLGDSDADEDEGVDGLGNFDEEYSMLTGTDGNPAYEMDL